jgi:hypothetical protein
VTQLANKKAPTAVNSSRVSIKQNSAANQSIVAAPRQQTSLTELAAEVHQLKNLLQSALARIDSLESQIKEKSTVIDQASAEVKRLEVACDSIGKHLIEDNLEIQNLPTSSLEDPLGAAIHVGEAIGCPVSEFDFKVKPSCDRKRLRLSFNSKLLRKQFLLAGKEFNRNHRRLSVGSHSHKIHVNEELSNTQRRLFEKAKSYKVTHQFKFLWFGSSGQLLIKKDENSPLHVIESLDTLNDENLLSKYERPQNESSGGPSSSHAQ